jgi:hypothetical protein
VPGVVGPNIVRLYFFAFARTIEIIFLLENVLALFALLFFPFALVSGFVIQVVLAASNTFVDFCINYSPKIFIFHTDSRKF